MDSVLRASWRDYVGLFLIALATLMYEILLTRIFSVTMSYHFAFMAISLAMFGMTLGALSVYLHPDDYSRVRLRPQLALASLLFGIFAILSFLLHCVVRFDPEPSWEGVGTVVFTYVVMLFPFIFSGICVCAALTKFPRQLSKLYAADLAGAAAGCILLIYTLKVTDGPTAVFVVALLASVAAGLFAADEESKKLHRASQLFAVGLAAFVIVNTILVQKQSALLHLRWAKGRRERDHIYEKWNAFSRIAVSGDPQDAITPISEGVSPTYPADRKLRQLMLTIDAGAETTLTAFDGDLSSVEHLKYDVKESVHYLRPDSRVLIVGAGGGRDVLSALVFDQKAICAVEMNGDILGVVNGRFGDFTGHLDRNPRVKFVNDEARSYIARRHEQFDIIQISFIDTWAITAAGGLALSENSLYTLEGWKLFLQHLSPRGILSVSRWYVPEFPGEAYRLTALAATALLKDGVETPREHLVLVRNKRPGRNWSSPGEAVTLLVSKAPFSGQDLDTVEGIARKMQFDIVLSPRFSRDPTFARLASGKDLESFVSSFPLNISPPTDDSPFFFNLGRLRDAFSWGHQPQILAGPHFRAIFVLGALLETVTVLTVLFILVPFVRRSRRETLPGAFPYLIFFAAIGVGFMLIEVSQMQRLIVFLGHPTYGLSVVLFVLLLSSGLGSFSTHSRRALGLKVPAIARLLLLLAVMLVFGLMMPRAIHAFQASTTPQRIAVAAGMLFPLGLVLGMAFPLGLKLASSQSPALTPWLWGINGATSVVGSVLAMAIALGSGISVTYWAGFFCYVAAFGAFAWASARTPSPVAAGIEGHDLRPTGAFPSFTHDS
jgi:hypothetical protein